MTTYELTVLTTVRETYEVSAESAEQARALWDNGSVTVPVMTDAIDAELESCEVQE